MGKYTDKIIHINATPEFLANPKCMEALEELCKRAYYYKPKNNKMEAIETVNEILDIKEKIKDVRQKINRNVETNNTEGFDYWTEVMRELLNVQNFVNTRAKAKKV